MISLLATLALTAITGFVLGYAFGSKSDGGFEVINEALNAQEDESRELRATLILIRNQGIASKSGTAQAMARKAKAAL